jgi:hypothetical protein
MECLQDVKLLMPKGVNLSVAAASFQGQLSWGPVGVISDLRVIGTNEVRFTLTAETEAGEYLCRCLREGKCEIELVFRDKPRPGGSQSGPKLGIRWADDRAHEAWLFRMNQPSLQAGPKLIV